MMEFGFDKSAIGKGEKSTSSGFGLFYHAGESATAFLALSQLIAN